MSKNQDNNNVPISQSAVEKLLDNQSKELEIRAQELSLRKIEIDHSQSYSLKALEAQKEDRKEIRNTHSSIIKLKIIAFSICFLLLLIFSGFAIYMGETQIIIEIIKVALPAIATGVGGYYFGRMKGHASASNDKNDE